jgi:hypothetical protein
MDQVTGERNVRPTDLNIRVLLTGILSHFLCMEGDYVVAVAVKWRPPLIKLLWYISRSK